MSRSPVLLCSSNRALVLPAVIARLWAFSLKRVVLIMVMMMIMMVIIKIITATDELLFRPAFFSSMWEMKVCRNDKRIPGLKINELCNQI